MSTTVDPKVEAAEMLKKFCPKGSKVFGIVRHVSRSGMSRRISFYAIQDNDPKFLDGYIARLGLYKRSKDKDGLIVEGCGMDMVFAVVHDLARTLYGDGYALNNECL